MKTIELNETNCKEYTTEELEAKLIEDATIKARKEVKKLHKVIKEQGFKSDEGKKAMLEESNIYKTFVDTYGEENLIIMKVGKASQFGKTLNSKGNGYGNF